ncbi:MAG: hypothetical protein ACP5UF_08045 [Hydrogenobaculum sp.]
MIELVIYVTSVGLSVMAMGFLADRNFIFGSLFMFMLLLFQVFVILGAKGDKEFPKAYNKDIKDVGLFNALLLIYFGGFYGWYTNVFGLRLIWNFQNISQ